jgi:hypothetical protein
LQQDTDRPYDACPFCLTEINVNDEPNADFEPEKLKPEMLEPEMPESETLGSIEAEPEVEETKAVPKKEEVIEAPSECAHYLGYLSEKGSSVDIPDECMMCKDIVTCMLNKMKT